MAYQVLARKWRPQDFAGVVGQGPIVTALRNALTEGRIAQAYLFSGIRGVGKTSVARVFAKALNCARGPAADPCNDCDPCRDITAGSDLDVIEVDAATYSKVEQVRELNESLKYGPARDRYKVVILDEIHRLSRQAFDALLKIVEEPPAHLVFIFATTEMEAVPATILSRCQEFQFRRVPAAEVADHLRFLAGEEEIEVSDAALRLIARAGEGSVRDAVALLDQLATFGSSTISDDDAARLLGGVDSALFHRLLESILDGRGDAVAAAVAEVESAGWDPRHVYGQFLSYCRDGLHLALGGDDGELDRPGEEAGALAAIASEVGYRDLLRLLNQLLASEATVRRSELGTLALEIVLLRAAELPRLTALEEVLRGAPSAGGAASGSGGSGSGGSGSGGGDRRRPARRAARPGPTAPQPPTGARPGRTAASAPAAPEPAGSAPPSAESPPPEASPPEASPSEADPSEADPSEAPRGGPDPGPGPASTRPEAPAAPPADDDVGRVLQHVSRQRQSLAAHLQGAQRLAWEDDALVIYTPPGDSWLPRALEKKRNREILAQALRDVRGSEADWKLREGRPAAPAPDPEEEGTDADEETAVSHPTVQTLLDIFDGTVEGVESPTSRDD